MFKDGNKRASVIFINHYLIAQGMGFLVIPEKDVPEFKKLLVQYYEGESLEVIGAFLKERCWKNFLFDFSQKEKYNTGLQSLVGFPEVF